MEVVPCFFICIAIFSVACQGDTRSSISQLKPQSSAATIDGSSESSGQVQLQAAVSCDQGTWTRLSQKPQINRMHIFCGEISRKNGKPKGFHSRPQGLNPKTIIDFKITQKANSSGVYGGIAHFKAKQPVEKFSTMFPDSCSESQVVASIIHAHDNPKRCPRSAPSWSSCGFSAPENLAQSSQKYCMGDNGTTLTIALATLSRGDINTAFPLYQGR